MIVHAVYFWLKPELSPTDTKLFVEGVKSLTTVSTVVHGWVGKPGPTDRPVVDRTYSYGLVVVFKDMAGHDAYQIDPIHKDFLDRCRHLWQKVTIYDSEG